MLLHTRNLIVTSEFRDHSKTAPTTLQHQLAAMAQRALSADIDTAPLSPAETDSNDT